MTDKIISHETAPGLIIGAEDAGFQHQDVLVLDNHVCRRTAQCERRNQMTVPVKDQQSVSAGLTDKYSLMGRISLQEGDDRAAAHPRHERTRSKKIGINHRLGWQGLVR